MTLYSMTEVAKNLYSLLEDEEVDEQVVTDTLESLGVEDKLEDYCKLIRQFEADAEAYKAEKMRLDKKRARAERNAERMKSAVIAYLQASNKTEEKAGTFALKMRNNESVVVDDINKINENFLKYAEPTVDKVGLKKALKAGQALEGCHIEVSQSLNIK